MKTKFIYTKKIKHAILFDENLQNLRDEIELLDGAGNDFDLDLISKGKLSPVFFGTALADFGVTNFLEHFLKISPAPGPRKTIDGEVNPTDEFFSGFIFKIQANMNPAHRDRLAFFRICSGTFEKGMDVTLSRTGKKMKLNQSTQLMANERENVETAIAGDIIGIYDTGNYQIGDTLTNCKDKLFFEPLPTFPPELFMKVRPVDTMKAKQFQKGVDQLAQEGAIQIFQELDAGMEEVIVGVVGVLQFDVLKYRLENEYNVDIIMENLPYEYIRWIVNKDVNPKELDLASDTKRIQDLKGNHLLLFTSYWSIDWALKHNKGLELREFGTDW